MKIIEIISEGTIRKNHEAASPGASIFPALDNNNSPYLAYRFGVALASSPDFDKDMDVSSAVGSQFELISYTDADDKIADAASKKIGVTRKQLAKKGSTETSAIHTTSPVATPKRNKYGI